MKKNARLKYKLFAFISLFVLLFSLCSISSFAWSVDSNGNLTSDNLFNAPDYQSTTTNNVTWYIQNQTLYLNGTSNNGSWTNLSTMTNTLDSGTYTMYWYTSYSGDDIGFGIRNSNTGLDELYQITSSRYKTFTIDSTTTFTTVVWWESSGIVFDNDYVQLMILPGTYNPDVSYEQYGKIYYQNQFYSTDSILNYTNLKYAYISYYYGTSNTDYFQFGFVKNGVFGDVDNDNQSFNWDNFVPNDAYFDEISSPYGMFYNTQKTLYQFQQDNASIISLQADRPFEYSLTFITPLYLVNSYFELRNFDNIKFFDYDDNLLLTANNSVNIQNLTVYRITCTLNDASELINNTNYLITGSNQSQYNYGYSQGYQQGQNVADSRINKDSASYSSGYDSGYEQGKKDFMNGIYPNSESYLIGFQRGKNEVVSDTWQSGYSAGYAQARADTQWIDSSTANVSDLFWTIGSTPWETFKHIWNVDLLGINIASIVTGLVTAMIIIWLIKKVWK